MGLHARMLVEEGLWSQTCSLKCLVARGKIAVFRQVPPWK